jgi:hypothetical protein
MCNYVATANDLFRGCVCTIIVFLAFTFSWWYGRSMINHVRIIFMTIWITELLGRFLDFIGLSYKIDLLTIYLLVWQLTSIEWRFILQQLRSPLMIIEQVLFCIFVALVSFAFYDAFFRYIYHFKST